MLEERRVAVAVKKGDDDLLSVVNQVIDELRKSGELRKMIERWRLPYLLG
jgi:ABC-type amino acid transport substrate-binding protein